MDSHQDGHRPTLREIASAWAFCGVLFLLIVTTPGKPFSAMQHAAFFVTPTPAVGIYNLIGLVASLWSFTLLVFGLARLFDWSKWRALAAVVVTTAVVLLALGTIVGVIVLAVVTLAGPAVA